MPRVNAPEFPRSGPGSAMVKSLHVRSSRSNQRRKKPFQKLLSLKDVNDELSFGSNSSNGTNNDHVSKSSFFITPKLVTKTAERTAHSKSTNRKVSFSSLVQEMNHLITTPKTVHQAPLKISSHSKKDVSSVKQYNVKEHENTTCNSTNPTKAGSIITPPQWNNSSHPDTICAPMHLATSHTYDIQELSNPWINLPTHSLAVDTRFIQTHRGNYASQKFIHMIQRFLYSCSNRGVLPTLLAVPCGCNKEFSDSENVSGKRLRAAGDGKWDTSIHVLSSHSQYCEQSFYSMLPRAEIRPPCNIGNIHHRDEHVHTPKSLMAHESWSLFASFVISILDKSRNVKSDKSNSQLDIHIITNDFALFSDTNMEHHRCGVELFQDKTRSYFEKGFIKNISIIIVDTDTFALWEANKRLGHSNHAEDQDSLEPWVHGGPTSEKENQDYALVSNLFGPHRLKVKECLRLIQDRLVFMRDLETKYADGSKICNPFHVELKVIDCNLVSFQTLLISWTIDAIRSIGLCFGFPGGNARIQFDLPCTPDGTQCSISLVLTYTTFPHRIDVPNKLWTDMKILHNSSFSILKMISESDIDLSLIYGIPFFAEPSSEGNLQQFKEMKCLVQQLCKYMIIHQVAIVLQMERPQSSVHNDGMYHSDKQIFILVAEEKIDNTSPSPSFLLYRYADSTTQFIHPHLSSELCESIDDMGSEATNDMYYEYIVRSLENVETSGINPFHTAHTEESKIKHDSSPVIERSSAVVSMDAINPSPSKLNFDAMSDEESTEQTHNDKLELILSDSDSFEY